MFDPLGSMFQLGENVNSSVTDFQAGFVDPPASASRMLATGSVLLNQSTRVSQPLSRAQD